MKILAIETSCDETGVALLNCTGDLTGASFTLLGNSLDSQAKLHAAYGGVYPALAKREHQENLPLLAANVLSQADMLKELNTPSSSSSGMIYHTNSVKEPAFKKAIETFLSSYEKPDIDLIAVTKGPGLEPALWTGISFAEALAKTWGIPLLGIDHMEGHIVSALLDKKNEREYVTENVTFPLMGLLISGGHTELVLMKEWFSYAHIGKTKDDAVGEAFDKVARLLDFPYPGGPHVQEAAARSRARGGTELLFPRPMKHDDTCDFSFSGLKTAVLYKLRQMEKISEEDKEAIAQAFEDAARDSVVSKTWRAMERTHAKSLAVGGGVSANAEIRRHLEETLEEHFPGTNVFFPEPELTGDNAVMIGAAAYLRHVSGKESDTELAALGSLVLT